LHRHGNIVYSLELETAVVMSRLYTSASIPDQDLIRQVAQQDKAAFSSLYDRYSQLALNLAWRVLSERQEAEDVVQEVFLQVWREAASYDQKRGSLSTWITTLTRSRAIDKFRSRKARRVYDTVNEDILGLDEQLPDTEIRPEDLDNTILVRKAFALLGREQRIAIEMAYYEGRSQTEIAEALREPLGTIKTRIRSALIKLRELIGPSLGN
jgi:RNA polymerase sigma-70 factor (ECF subfamily)